VSQQSADQKQARQLRHLRMLAVLAVGMFGFGFALVPLYGLFCDLTGVQRGGLAGAATPESAPRTVSGPVLDRTVVVKFDGTVHPDLPWDFGPEQRRLEVHPGATYEVRFTARNRSNKPVTGQAIPAIAPWQATGYFHKLECFCFRQQTLEGGENLEMPLRFTVSPDLPPEINSLTLSYSFLRLAEGHGALAGS
jgi:cytochrome c oxidase assembly protein subunit 11